MTLHKQTLSLPDREIAYQQVCDGKATKEAAGVIFLGGFASDMEGTKASALALWAEEKKAGYTRFDYCGHGISSGAFENATIGSRASDALQVLDHLTEGPQILIGSSLGGWIGLLLARTRPERIAGYIGIAAAPDFTEDLIRPILTPAQKEALERDGKIYEEPHPTPESKPITNKLMEEAKEQLVLRTPLKVNGPVHLIQGKQDEEVPWRHALKIAAHIEAPRVDVTLLEGASHRLSREEDMKVIFAALEAMRG